MRLLTSNLLATMLLLMGASVASAVNFHMTSNYNGTDLLDVSDTVTVNIFLNTEGQADIQLADVGIQFDGSIIDYNIGASSMTSYLLYSAQVGKTIPPRWLQPLPSHCAPNPCSPPFDNTLGAKPVIFTGLIPDLITVGYQTPDFGGTQVTGEGLLLATIVLHITDLGDGQGFVNILMTSANIVQLATGPTNITNQVTTTGSFTVYTVPIPEPGTAIMVGLGLAGLAVAGKRRRA